MQRSVIILLSVSLLFSYAYADLKPDEKSLNATKIMERIKIDGFLNEAVWAKGETAANFTQTDPDEGEPARYDTKVVILYDDEALYFGFTCYDDEPDNIVKVLAARDSWTSTDKVQVEIDSYHDHITSYFFEVNASGVQRDAYRSNEDNYDMSWNCVWQAETSVGPYGWTAEYRIPFSCLRFTENSNMEWGINFTRWNIRFREASVWNFKPKEIFGEVAHFGHLKNLKSLKPSKNLEILPYAVSSQNTQPKSLGNPNGHSSYSNMGIDLKYGLSSNLTIDATFNPDFGQVESDPATINLGTFETYFSEKRPFFIEGSSNFDTDYNLFYSRRIGRAPQDEPDDLDYYTNQPLGTTIIGAAKITGKTSNGWEIGFLNAVTDREQATYINTNGEQNIVTTEEPANYNIARVKKEYESGSSFGFMSTMAHQNKYSPTYTAGIDWNLFVDNRNYSTSGQIVGSRLGLGNKGIGFQLGANKRGGKNVRGSVWYEYETRDLDLNRLGYQRRANFQVYVVRTFLTEPFIS